jgi:integrase
MATFKQYIKKDGSKAWMFQTHLGTDYVTGKSIKTTRRGFKTKKEAQAMLSKVQVDFSNNSGLVKESRTTFKKVYESWLLEYEESVKRSTYSKITRRLEINILPFFGNMIIEKIDAVTARQLVKKWDKQYNTPLLYSYIVRIVNYGISLNWYTINPFATVNRPKREINPTKGNLKYYTKNELKIFLSTAHDRANKSQGKVIQYYANLDCALFRLLAFSGIRISEALAMNWSDISFDKNYIQIDKTVSSTAENEYFIDSAKTENSERSIELDEKTIYTLKKWKLQQKEFNFAIGNPTQNNLVFKDWKGKMMNKADTYQRSNRIADAANLHHIGNHGFRHTHATMLFEAGAEAKAVQERLGHANIEMTLDIYTHVSKDNKKKTVAKLVNYVTF